MATREQLLDLAKILVDQRWDMRAALQVLRATPYAFEKRPTLQSLIASLEYASDQSSTALVLPARLEPTPREANFWEKIDLDRIGRAVSREDYFALATDIAALDWETAVATYALARTPYAKRWGLSELDIRNSYEGYKGERDAISRWIEATRDLRDRGLRPRPPLSQRLLDSSAIINKESRDRFYVQMLTGMAGRPDLYFQWNVAHPEAAIPTGDGHYEMLSQNKPAVEYRGDPFSTSGPFVGVQRLMSMPVPMPEFYKTVYGNYENRIRDAIVEIVERIEDTLSPERMSWGEVRNRDTGEVYGTMRVFDGTVARRDDVLTGGPLVSTPADSLVFQRILEARGIDYKWKGILREIKARHPFRRFFEIGKLSLDKNADPEVRERALLLLESFILEQYVLKYPNALFFAHTATEANKLLDMRRYGFKVVEIINVPGSSTPEHILMVPAKKLKKILTKRIKDTEAKLASKVQLGTR